MRYQNDAMHSSYVDHGWLHTHPSSIPIMTFNGIKIEQKKTRATRSNTEIHDS